MKNNVQNNNELDLLDLLKMLLSKLKLIICIALVAAIVGGALGAVITIFGKHSFGTQVEFYITPSSPDSHVLHLLSSERFAEKLLLDENGLPKNASGEAYEEALAAKEAYDKANEDLAEAKKASKEAPRELAIAQKTYEEKQKAYEDVYNLLSVYKSAQDEIAKQEGHKEKLEFYEDAVSSAKLEKEAAEKLYYAVSQKVLEINHKLEASKENATKAKKLADEISESILREWREQDENKEKISKINESIEYSYIDIDNLGSENATNNRQFLMADISVPKDEELAKTLLNNICEILPAYVIENRNTAEAEEETECILISTAAEIEDLAKNSLAKNIIKFSLISAVAALAITCILVLWIGVKAQEPCTKKDDEYAENGDIDAPLR